jgi:hypothetical protein
MKNKESISEVSEEPLLYRRKFPLRPKKGLIPPSELYFVYKGKVSHKITVTLKREIDGRIFKTGITLNTAKEYLKELQTNYILEKIK